MTAGTHNTAFPRRVQLQPLHSTNMDHGDHGGHGDMDMGPKCSMNMLWCVSLLAPAQCSSPTMATAQEHTNRRHLHRLTLRASLNYVFLCTTNCRNAIMVVVVPIPNMPSSLDRLFLVLLYNKLPQHHRDGRCCADTVVLSLSIVLLYNTIMMVRVVLISSMSSPLYSPVQQNAATLS